MSEKPMSSLRISTTFGFFTRTSRKILEKRSRASRSRNPLASRTCLVASQSYACLPIEDVRRRRCERNVDVIAFLHERQAVGLLLEDALACDEAHDGSVAQVLHALDARRKAGIGD